MSVLLFIALAVVCLFLNAARKRAASDAQVARNEYARTVAELDQLRGELTIARERLSAAASVEASLTQHVAERDLAVQRIEELQREIAARSRVPDTTSTGALAELDRELADKRMTLAQLQQQIGALDAEMELQSFGLYRNHYAFNESAGYAAKLEEVRGRQAAMLKAKTAVTLARTWAVDGSVQKGQQMAMRLAKLMLRAFNGECDASIAKARFNNVVALEERIRTAFEAINKLTETQHCAIAAAYLELKIEELRLAYEHALKLYEEREEQRRLREMAREEEIIRREQEERLRTAEQAERLKADALESARRELSRVSSAERAAYEEKLARLEAELAEAHALTEREISNAQLTRVGHVYIISNEGSFGSNVYKIGMTRRDDPLDRVRELGDASVPFAFDVHGIIPSLDAPELERKLHRILNATRVNLVNARKEFFAVTLGEIEAAVKQCHAAPIELTKLAIAEEWRRSLAVRQERVANTNAVQPNAEPRENARARAQ